MAHRIAVLALVLALLAPATAAAQQNPFGPLPQPVPTPAPPPPDQNDPFGSDIGRTTLYIIAGALLVGFVAVGVFIARDARRSLPKEAEHGLRDEGPHRHQRKAKARARAKGKAQRAARRQNR
jgi:hypothetical protein